jgi:Arc/MetJ-type ribon-helix-helix transcriptional regulator
MRKLATKTVSVSLTPALLDRLERQRQVQVRRLGITSRSQVVRLALQEWLDQADEEIPAGQEAAAERQAV